MYLRGLCKRLVFIQVSKKREFSSERLIEHECRCHGRDELVKMKATVALFYVVSIVLSLILPGLGPVLPFAFAVAFGVYGLVVSASRHLNTLNDLPNAFRVFLASLGGYLMTLDRVFIFPSAGVLLFFGSVYLNDEYQRRALYSLRKGRRGGSVALLGIDGSGKSSHSTVTSGWLEGRGYRVKLMPFHRYLFVERLSSLSSAVRGPTAAARKKNPLRPFVSLVDNLILQLSSSFGCRVEGTVVIYDRFIWSTYIKYEALGYPVRPLSLALPSAQASLRHRPGRPGRQVPPSHRREGRPHPLPALRP